MTMMTWKWKRAGSGLVAGTAAALLIGASVAPAMAAAPTWTVKPGGVITGKTTKTILRDSKTGVVLTCTSSVTKATLKKGSHLSGAGIGVVTAIGFTNCTGPVGLKFTVKTSHLPWKLNTVSYNKVTRIATGTITGIHATLSGSGCSAAIDGTGAKKDNGMVRVMYSNKSHKLTVLIAGGNLHVFGVNGCLGLINNGDGSTFTAAYAITPTTTITSP